MAKYINAYNSVIRMSDKPLRYPWLLVNPKPDENDIQSAVDHIEQVLGGVDWLGTGSSQVAADLEQQEAWDHWEVIRRSLGLEKGERF